jgi:hypothetical protein
VLDDVLHHEGRGEFWTPGRGGELGVVELLEGGQVSGEDLEQVVGFAEEALGVMIWAMPFTACSKEVTVSRSAPRMVTNTSASKVRPTVAGFSRRGSRRSRQHVRAPAPAMARRHRRTHPVGQLGQGQPAIILRYRTASEPVSLDRV